MTGPAARLAPHIDAILDRLAEAVTVQDADGRLVYANEAAARLLGFEHSDDLLSADTAAIIGAYEILDEHGAPLPIDRLPGRRVLAGEQPEPVLVQYVVRATGARRFTVTKATSIDDGAGQVLFAVNIMEDVTGLMRAEQEQRLLADASKALSSSLDPDLTIEKVAWALVPEIADWASVHLPDSAGRLPVAAVAHIDHEQMGLTRELFERFPPMAGANAGVGAVVRTGRSELWVDVPEEVLAGVAQSDEHLAMMHALGYRSVITVPLVARGEVLGALVLSSAASGRRFDERDLAVAEELGRRAGNAFDNARQHESRARIAATLQRSLLPPGLPDVPGLVMAARFRSAEEGTEVGGDFYDVFAAGDRWFAVMGDVTGKGPAAAAVTGLARYTLRTAAMYESEPSAILRRLNETLLGEQRQCSAVCSRLERADDGWHVSIACAGHPLPFLLRPGEPPAPLGCPGTLGGAFAEGRATDEVATLRPGDTLLFYTDGVTDARGAGGRFEIERLVALLDGLAGAGADTIVGTLDAALREYQTGPQRDDVALLALEVATRA